MKPKLFSAEKAKHYLKLNRQDDYDFLIWSAIVQEIHAFKRKTWVGFYMQADAVKYLKKLEKLGYKCKIEDTEPPYKDYCPWRLNIKW